MHVLFVMGVIVGVVIQVLRICFPNDLRVNEVRRMLQSALPVRVNIVQKPEVG